MPHLHDARRRTLTCGAAHQRRRYPCYLWTNLSQQLVKMFHRHSKVPTETMAIKA